MGAVRSGEISWRIEDTGVIEPDTATILGAEDEVHAFTKTITLQLASR